MKGLVAIAAVLGGLSGRAVAEQTAGRGGVTWERDEVDPEKAADPTAITRGLAGRVGGEPAVSAWLHVGEELAVLAPDRAGVIAGAHGAEVGAAVVPGGGLRASVEVWYRSLSDGAGRSASVRRLGVGLAAAWQRGDRTSVSLRVRSLDQPYVDLTASHRLGERVALGVTVMNLTDRVLPAEASIVEDDRAAPATPFTAMVELGLTY